MHSLPAIARSAPEHFSFDLGQDPIPPLVRQELVFTTPGRFCSTGSVPFGTEP